MRKAALPSCLSILFFPGLFLPVPAFALRSQTPLEGDGLAELAAGLEEGVGPKQAIREFRQWIWNVTAEVTVALKGFSPRFTFVSGDQVKINPKDPEDRRIVEGFLNRLPEHFRVRWEESLPNEEPRMTLVFVGRTESKKTLHRPGAGDEPSGWEKGSVATLDQPATPVFSFDPSDWGVEYLIAGDDPDLPEEPLPVHIRWMIRPDLPEILSIADSLAPPSGWKKADEKDFLRFLRFRNVIGMVAEAKGDVVGFMVYELHKKRLHIVTMMVHPEYRDRGVGHQMVEKLKSKLSLQGRASLTLIVPESNLKAQQFLGERGFKAMRTDRGYFDAEDGYRMRYTVPVERRVRRDDSSGLEERVAQVAALAEETAQSGWVAIVSAVGLERNPALEAMVMALEGTWLADQTIIWGGAKPGLDLPTAQGPEELADILNHRSQVSPVTAVTFLGDSEEGSVVELCGLKVFRSLRRIPPWSNCWPPTAFPPSWPPPWRLSSRRRPPPAPRPEAPFLP